MQLTLMQLDFSVSLNACHDEIMHKMQVLTNMQIQLLRKFQHQLGNSEMHFEMIHDVRVMIVNLEQVYKDVKEYFNQMGIQFVYDFFRKIQVLMVCGYNFMSQALLVNVDKIQDKKIKQLTKASVPDCKVCKCTCDNSKNKKRQIKQVQHFDYKISMLQNEEQKLTSQIQNIYQKMMMQKTMIQKTKPSLAMRELEDMKEHIQNVMESTNSIFEETYMMKYVEFKNYLTQIKKPEDIVDYFVSNMNFNMKDKFLKAMQKAIYKAQNMDLRIELKHLKDSETQTDNLKEQSDYRDSTYKAFSSLKPQKNISLLTKERRYNQQIVAQLQYLKKQLKSLLKEVEKLKAQLQVKQAQRNKSAQNYETLQQLYNNRTLELDEVKHKNIWLTSQKQNQTKKLRHQIKQLKKQQVKMVTEQTQTYIPPNCVSVSTQTEIIYFQNEVDNQIINVLKKANEKMINSLNEKEKKLRELKVTSEEMVNLKQCKLSCMAFLHDLRQVTEYKMAQLNKQAKTINPDKISTSKQPIIPLNEFTTIKSVNITIQKLSQDIKKLLLSQPNKTKQNQRRRSSVRIDSRLSGRLSINERRSSKASQFSGDKSGLEFFKNVNQRQTSMITGKSDLKSSLLSFENKKFSYNNADDNKSYSQSSISQKNSQQGSQQRNTSSHNQRSTSSGPKMSQVQPIEKKQPIKSQVQRGSVFCQKVLSQTIVVEPKQLVSNPVHCSVQVQTDILRLQNHHRASYMNKNNNQVEKVIKYQTFVLYGEYSQQTDLTDQMLTKFEQTYSSQTEQIQKLKTALTETIKTNYLSPSNRKNQYMIRKPGKTEKIYTQQSDRNYVSINNSLPINEKQISQNIQEHINKTIYQQSVGSNTSFGAHMYPSQRTSFNNMTLQSRLSALINPQNRSSVNSGLVVFKKPKNEYEKRSTQVMSFDEFKMDKSLTKEKPRNQSRNISFNTQRAEASFNLHPDNKNHWKQMISKIEEECEMDKENHSVSSKERNLSKAKNKPHQKTNFVERISEQEDTLIYKKSITRQDTLIDVSKKTPIERERRVSPRSFQPPENAFNRAVKHMLMTTESQQSLMKNLQNVCESLEKEKEQKRIKKTTKQVITARDSSQSKRYSSKQNSQLFKLAEILG